MNAASPSPSSATSPDEAEHGAGDQPCADVAAGIAGRRRHADEQRHRQRLGPQLDRPTAAGDRPPVDERRHRRRRSGGRAATGTARHCRGARWTRRDQPNGLAWELNVRGASAIAATHDRTADDPSARAQGHHRVHALPQPARRRPLPGLDAPLHTRPGARAGRRRRSSSVCRRQASGCSWRSTDDDDRLLGDVAVWLDDAALLAMIGYTLAPESQGQGLRGRSGARRSSTGCSPARKVHRVAATIDPANVASARVLERNGFRYIGTARSAALVRGVWSDDARFEILADEWRAWKRRPGRPRRVELVEITPQTVRRVGELDRAFSQRRFVSSVYQSYGDALVPPIHDGYSRRTVVPRDRGRRRAGRIHDGRRAAADPAPSVPLAADDRLAPSRSRHRPRRDRGARPANARRQGATHLLLSCTADVTGSPSRSTRRLGFERTGTVNEWGETEMIAPLERLLPAPAATAQPRASGVSDAAVSGIERARSDQSAST